MNCQDIARILDEKEVDSLLAEERCDVQAHLATCRDCTRDWHIHAQLMAASIPAVPAELRAHYATPVAGVANAGARRRGRFVAGSVVAVAALAAAAAMLVYQAGKPPVPVAATVDPAQAELSVKELATEAFPLLMKPLSEDESKAAEEWTGRLVEWLAIRDDPEALIAAAVLSMGPAADAQRIRSLFQRATALAPENSRIQATAMLLCLAFKPCDTTPYEQALRRIAPYNALGWADEVARASQAGDREAFQNALAAMSRAGTFDFYWNASIVAMTSQMHAALVAPAESEAGKPPVSRELIAIGAVAAMPIPAFQPITKFCQSAANESSLLQCRQIGAAMRAGDTVLANSLGLNISGYALPDSAEARLLAQQRNQIKWLMYAQGLASLSEERPIPPGYMKALADHPREIDALRAFLEEQGIPTEPPPGWKP